MHYKDISEHTDIMKIQKPMDINSPAVWDASPMRIPCTPNSKNAKADIMPITASSANLYPPVY